MRNLKRGTGSGGKWTRGGGRSEGGSRSKKRRGARAKKNLEPRKKCEEHMDNGERGKSRTKMKGFEVRDARKKTEGCEDGRRVSGA